MILLRRVGNDLWLGLARAAPEATVPPSRRLALDREMADLAEAAAVRAVARARSDCAVSRSHTRGVAAALAAPVPARLGVDIVRLDRVTRRHAVAVADARELGVLAGHGAMAYPLAWALKEAAAKATGDPPRWFPGGIRIVPAGGALAVQWIGQPGRAFRAGWLCWGHALCAWVHAEGPDLPGENREAKRMLLQAHPLPA